MHSSAPEQVRVTLGIEALAYCRKKEGMGVRPFAGMTRIRF
jgi:hypothetical protein